MATKFEIIPARLSDVWAFERMRPADAAEVLAVGGYSPVEAVIESWAASKEAWTARFNGEVGCMFGAAPHPTSTLLMPTAVIWALTTTVVDKYPVTFVRFSKLVVRDMHRKYGLLINYVDARYHQAVNWAEVIGFKVHPTIPLGKQGELFHPITYGD